MEIGEIPLEVVPTTPIVEQSVSSPSPPKEKNPGRKVRLIDKLADLIVNNKKEALFTLWNLSLYMWEILRDTKHLGPDEPGAIPGVSLGKPIATEGAWGFIDQHIGDTVEVLELFYLTRIPVSFVAKMVEMTTNKKVDPRIKLGVSLFLSTIIVSGLELSWTAGNTPDPYDLVGVVAGAIWASVGYEVIDYLFKERETPLFEQWAAKIFKMAKSMENIDKKVIAKLNSWIGIPNQQPSSDISTEQVQTTNQVPNISPVIPPTENNL